MQSDKSGNENNTPIPKTLEARESLLRCIIHPGDYNKAGDTFRVRNLAPRKGKDDVSSIRGCHCTGERAKRHGLEIASKRPGKPFSKLEGFFHFTPELVAQAFSSYQSFIQETLPFSVWVVPTPIYDESSPYVPWPEGVVLCQENGYFPAHADLKFSLPMPNDGENDILRDHIRAFVKVLYDIDPNFLVEEFPSSADAWSGPNLCQQLPAA